MKTVKLKVLRTQLNKTPLEKTEKRQNFDKSTKYWKQEGVLEAKILKESKQHKIGEQRNNIDNNAERLVLS